jgi:hypothetical protein
LQRKFSPIDACGLLFGAGIGILETAFDKQAATEYMTQLAAQMRGEPETPPTMN